MIARLLLPLMCLGPAAEELPRSTIPERDLAKCAKDATALFTALDPWAEDRKAQAEALEGLAKAMAASAKKAKIDDPLRYVGDWELLLELAKPEDRTLKGQVGKGFVRHAFVLANDPKDAQDDERVACLLSIPASYGKSDALPPVILALKPELGLADAELEAKVRELAGAAYGTLAETYLIVVPLGVEEGSGRSAKIVESQGSWQTPEAAFVMYSAFRVVLEQLRFDRSRVILDGWGAAGVDALRIGTSFPSWFAGIVNRSGEIGGPEILWSNLDGGALLYVRGAADGREIDADALTASHAAVTVLEIEESALAPGAEALGQLAAWMAERRRDLAPLEVRHGISDPSYQSVGWLKAEDPRLRANARPGDKDFPRMTGRIDKASNTIHIETVNVLELSVYLNDALVDLDKPVSIVVNGRERSSRKYVRDLRLMLENRFFNSDGFYGLYPASQLITEIEPNIPDKQP